MAGSRLETWYTPDGRDVLCPSRNEAADLWSEHAGDGPFARATADLRAGEAVLDVGAHVGLSALYVAGNHPGLRILAFEPAPRLHACLSRNLSRHAPGASALELALGAGAGELTLSYRPMLPAISTLVDDADDERRAVDAKLSALGADEATRADVRLLQQVEEKVRVRVESLGAVLREQVPEPVGLIRIDVERAELAVLAGVSDEGWPRIRQVMVDVHDLHGRLSHVVDMLRGRGFSVEVRQTAGFVGSSVHTVHAHRHAART